MPAKTEGARLWPVRVGLALAVGIYLVYSSFGIAGPFLWGHHGYHGATYMLRAMMTLRFHLFTPATANGFEVPTPASYYFHHPMGYHHLLDLPILLFGPHEWIARGMAAIGGLFTLWALYVLVRRWWSREAALLSVSVYVGLPILCSFSVLSDPMLPAMACTIVVADAFLGYMKEPDSRRWLVIACAFTALGGFLMWEAYFQAVIHSLHMLGWALATRKRVPGRMRAWLRWTLAVGISASVMMAFHLIYTVAHQFGADFVGSFSQRHNALFSWVVERHKLWLSILYGWWLVGIGLFWLVLFFVRLAIGRGRMRDQAVLICFEINSLYIYLFAEGSSVHLYRVFFFSTFLTLAVTDLVWDLYALIKWLLRARPTLARYAAAGGAAAAIALYFSVEAPHAYNNLIESRVVMGTHGLPGYNADYSKQLFGMEVAKRTGPKDWLIVHDSMPRRVEFAYYADRNTLNISSLGQVAALQKLHPSSVILMGADPSGLDQKLLIELLRKHPAYRYDGYLMVDLRSSVPGVHEYQFMPQKMTWQWRWFYSHKYPPMVAELRNNPYSQCLHALAEATPPRDLPPPIDYPSYREDLGTCLFNSQVLRGDQRALDQFLAKLWTRATRKDVALGTLGRVVALRVNGRTGADVWTRLDRLPPGGLPADVVTRWRLVPVGAPPSLSTAQTPFEKTAKGTAGTLPPIQKTATAETATTKTATTKTATEKTATEKTATVAATRGAAIKVPPPPSVPKLLTGEVAPAGQWAMTTQHSGYLYFESPRWSVAPGKYRLLWEIGRPAPPPPVTPWAIPVARPVIGPGALPPPRGVAAPKPGVAPTLAKGRAPLPGGAPPTATKGRIAVETKAIPLPVVPLPVRPLAPLPPPIAAADLGEIEIR